MVQREQLPYPASADTTRRKIEIVALMVAFVWSSSRVAQIDPLAGVAMAALGAAATGWSLSQNALWRNIDAEHYRPGADAGLVHAVLLVPMILAGRLVSSVSLEAPLSRAAELYLAYNLHQSLVFGITVLVWTVISSRVRANGRFAALVLLANLAGAVVVTTLSGEPVLSGLFVHAIVSLVVQQTFTGILLLLFPKSFTLAEACIVSSLLSLLGMDAWTATFFRFNVRYLPAFMDLERLPVHLFLESLILGMILIGVVTAPVLVANRAANRKHGFNSITSIVLTLAFLAIFASITFLVISPWMRAFLRQDPFEWTFAFIGDRPFRLVLTAYWALAIIVSVAGLSLAGRLQDATARSPLPASDSGETRRTMTFAFKHARLRRLPLILVRKYFHLLAVLMFSPGYIIEPLYLQLAFGVALSALLAAEYVRYFQLAFLGAPFQAFFGAFVDERDSGPLILSHLYLLVGCALPVWAARAPPDAFFAGFAGILELGVGDTMASVFGVWLGRRRWPQTSKTLEGTIAGIAAVIFTAAVLGLWCPPAIRYSVAQWSAFCVAAVIAGLLEAVTKQNDNLIVPMFFFAVISLI